jgi:hypothetical protein
MPALSAADKADQAAITASKSGSVEGCSFSFAAPALLAICVEFASAEESDT